MARRASILLATLLIITLAALVGTTVLYRADAQRGAAMTAMERAQLRALAWSGVQGAMEELSSQRDDLMQGQTPTLTASWDLFTGSVRGSVRLAGLTPDGAVVVSEDAKLDINVADAAMIGRLKGVGETLGGKIAAAKGRGFGSPEELSRVEGVSADALFVSGGADAGAGDSESADGGSGEPGQDDPGRGSAGQGSSVQDGEATPSLLSRMTVFSFDPNVCAGVGPAASGDELARENISGGWVDGMDGDLKDRMSETGAGLVQSMLAGGTKPAHMSDVVAALRRIKAPQESWAEVLGAVTTSDEAYARGRVDINRATAEVLACVPGIDAEAADKIVEARTRLDEGSRKSVTWPLKERLLTEDQFQQAADWITTRSLQWRVRVEARLERSSPDEVDKTGEAPQTPAGAVWEAVIDVSGSRARVAYLRDVTYLGTLAQQAKEQAGSATPGADDGGPVPADRGPATDQGPVAETGDVQGSGPSGKLNTSKLNMSGDLKFDGMEGSGGLKMKGMEGSGGLKMNGMEGSGGLKMSTDLNFGGGDDVEPKTDAADGGAGTGAKTGTDVGTKPAGAKDRRIGRWRAPSKE